ncbi:MAG: hypothetical protein WAW90_01550 [Minisyncoccia bacterium]
MKRIIYIVPILAIIITLFLPPVALAAVSGGLNVSGNGFNIGIGFGGGSAMGGGCGANTICTVAMTFIYIINSVLVPLLFAVSFIVFLYGVFKTYIYSHGDPGEVSSGHQTILWGVIGFVVMVSLWGLVNVVSNSFGLGGFGAPPTPTSY